MGILEPIFIMCIELPVWILIDASKRWSKYLNEDDPWSAFLRTLLVILIFILIGLWILGYR